MIVLIVVTVLLGATDSEYFSDGEYSFAELSNQWEYLSKFSYTSQGKIEVVCKFNKPVDGALVRLELYQLTVESWDSVIRSTTVCSDRIALSTVAYALTVEEDKDTEEERKCFNYYEESVCTVTKYIDGSKLPWVFVAISYCGNRIEDLELKWKIHSTNGESFLRKEVPVSDMGLYQAYLAFTIISAVFALFWLLYYKTIQLNMRVLIPYKIALFVSLVAFALITGFYGRLLNTGYRNSSLFYTGYIFSMFAYILIVQSSLAAVWSGSIMTVHLPRWKAILTFLLPVAYVIATGAVFTVGYLDVEQRDVYPFEQRPDRYLVWVACGISSFLWLLYTVPIIATLTSTEDTISYLRVLYLLISLYLLGVGGSPLIANFNMAIEHRKMFVLTFFGATHVFNFVFLFACIFRNHSCSSVLHFWGTLFRDYLCCKFKLCPCWRTSNKTGSNTLYRGSGSGSSPGDMCGQAGSKSRDPDVSRDRDGCRGCCLKICPCLSCCSCCKGDDDDYNRYHSETGLKKVLVKNRNVRDDEFDIQIVDVDQEERRPSPDHIVQVAPKVTANRTTVQPLATSQPPPTPEPSQQEYVVEIVEGFSDEERNAKKDVDYKVLPWLYQDKPREQLTPKRRFRNAVIQNAINVKEHGYVTEPNHWVNGNYKPFATADNKPIVLYKKPSSSQLFSASITSFDKTSSTGKPVTILPYMKQMSVPLQPRHNPGLTSQLSVPASSSNLLPHLDNTSPRARRTVNSLHAREPDPLEEYVVGDPQGFNMTEYNSSKLRDTKVKTVTMMYRRETLKQNLNNIPTSLLLQRVPDGTAKDNDSQVVSKTKVVREMQQKPKPEPKLERSKSSLWRMLAKKYNGKLTDESTSSAA